ncbi:MAG: hypothetical protein ACOCXT_01370 [Candidatus Dojkabacteria bacterium]
MKVPAKKYIYIIKNSFLEGNQSFFSTLLSLVYPLIEISGLVFLYSYITSDDSGFLTRGVVIYFSFILVTTTLDYRRFASKLQSMIVDERYINIDQMPVHPFFYTFCESIGRSFVTLMLLITIGIGVLLFYGTPVIGVMLYIPVVLICLLLSHLIYYNYTLLTFYAEKHVKIWFFGIIFDFLSGKLVPLGFLPMILQKVFLSFMPFVYAAGALGNAFSDFNLRTLLTSSAIALFWVLLLIFTGNRIWAHGGRVFQERG